MADKSDRDTIQGKLWAEIRNKVRDSDLTAEDKVKALRFLSGKAQEMADSDKDPDLDGKLADLATKACEVAVKVTETIAELAGVVSSNSAFISSNDQSYVRTIQETAGKLRRDAEAMKKVFEARRPNIVERVAALDGR